MIEDLKLSEISIVLEVSESGSLREVARSRQTSPGQISKVISNVEHKIGIKLLERTVSGAVPTPQSAQVFLQLLQIRERSLGLQGLTRLDQTQRTFSFATTSFLGIHLIPSAINEIQMALGKSKFRIIDLPPSQFVPIGMRSGFELCVHLGRLNWPQSWSSKKVGDLHWGLYARSDHSCAKVTSEKKIRGEDFVFPIYWSDNGLKYGDDHCPLPISKRRIAAETATATCAVELIENSDYFGFVPELVARNKVNEGKLKRVKIREWKAVKEPIYLSVKSDAVKQQEYKEICRCLSNSLSLI